MIPGSRGSLYSTTTDGGTSMFRDTPAYSGFSVPDIAEAKRFYGETLGLEVEENPEGLALHLAGGTRVFVYPSEQYTAPKHTILNFTVDDIDAAVNGLAEHGVTMERYDMPGIKTDDRGIFRADRGPAAIAWFKDPADHVIAVIQER
jgi:catechol 2,3-dioxygenase-like lactoylglutathione lyase family enzyme